MAARPPRRRWPEGRIATAADIAERIDELPEDDFFGLRPDGRFPRPHLWLGASVIALIAVGTGWCLRPQPVQPPAQPDPAAHAAVAQVPAATIAPTTAPTV